jgi:hypothetical protein
MKPKIWSLLFIFLSIVSFSQTHNVTGVVSDETSKGLESANVIAKPLQEKASLKFAIADNKGRYRLELEPDVKYEITVSYLGYVAEVLILEPNATITTHDFKLKSTGVQLKEIVIKHVFDPVVIKKDTLTFDVKSFANGNERKMKEILEKLPGVEVDKYGVVRVQGKKVTKMLVEGKLFFGGGSKLAVENIPADALDKIEVIDHFNEVGFMKEVSDSQDLAMNVKLKADKKKFVFGDIEAGLGVGLDKSCLIHSGLFYYTPKVNYSFIGDANNIGRSTFTFEDLARFSGGFSSFLSERKSLSNLFQFVNDNKDLVQNKSQFGAINFGYDASSKLSITGFAIVSKVLTENRITSKNNYLQNSAIAFENSSQDGNSSSVLGIGNVKLDYSPNKKEKWFYNAQLQSSNNNFGSTLNSITNTNNSLFETISKADNTSVKQYAEWHKNYNLHHTTTFVVNQVYQNSLPQNRWFTNQPFFTGLIPLQTDASFTIEQIKKVKVNSVDALFKHYWIINNSNHLYTNIGTNFEAINLETSEKQLLTNGQINNFESNGFGNNTKYQLNDTYIGLEYKFKIGKWTNKTGLYYHWYQLQTNQIGGVNSLSKILFQPQWNSDFDFNKSESLNFSYKLVNNFADVSQLANRYTLNYYNLVYKGNALLENEKYHNANLRYSKTNMFSGITWNGNLNFTKKEKTIRNEIKIDGINQYNSPILTNNPETNLGFNGSFSKKIYHFNLKLNTNINWFDYSQTLNNQTTKNERKSQELGLVFKTAYKKWPDFRVEYSKGFSQFSGITKSNYQTDAVSADFEATFFKFWTYKLEYENLKNTNNNNQSNYFDIANTSLRYQKKNSPYSFELTVNNLLDVQKKNSYSFSDYIISEQSQYILPRVLLFSISYKL